MDEDNLNYVRRALWHATPLHDQLEADQKLLTQLQFNARMKREELETLIILDNFRRDASHQ